MCRAPNYKRPLSSNDKDPTIWAKPRSTANSSSRSVVSWPFSIRAARSSVRFSSKWPTVPSTRFPAYRSAGGCSDRNLLANVSTIGRPDELAERLLMPRRLKDRVTMTTTTMRMRKNRKPDGFLFIGFDLIVLPLIGLLKHLLIRIRIAITMVWTLMTPRYVSQSGFRII